VNKQVTLMLVDTLFITNFVNSINARVQLRARLSLWTFRRKSTVQSMRKRHFATAVLLSKIDSSRPDEYRYSINLINSLNRLLSLNYVLRKKQIIHREEIAIILIEHTNKELFSRTSVNSI